MRARTRSAIRRTLAGATSVLLLATAFSVASDVVATLPANAAQNPTSCPAQITLSNPSFESPAIPANAVRLFPETAVPAWDTTDSLNQIEFWSNSRGGFSTPSGRQWVELNANSAGMLYQDIVTTPGRTLSWSLKHRGRLGVDTMRVVIGAPAGPLIQNGPNLSDGPGAWGTHSGTYTVPAGQTVTRFGFEAVSSAGGNNGAGNFLDDIAFGTAPCVITAKSVTNVTRGGTTAQVGDTLRYSVNVSNLLGGTPATQTVSTDVLGPGLDYVPGSIKIVSGQVTGAMTDAALDDRGEFLAPSRTVQLRLGDDATASTGGAIRVGASTTYTFEAKVNVAGAGTTVLNEATVRFFDGVSGQTLVSTSQQTQTPVDQLAADVAITNTLGTTPVVAGQPATFTINVTNIGPQVATGVTVSGSIPLGLTNVSATSPGASCTVTSVVTCSVPNMPVGQSVPITLTGTVSSSANPGSSVTSIASVSTSSTDIVPANNNAIASGTVTTRADVSITKAFLPADPIAGANATYTITAHNNGPSDARDVAITDPIDPDTTFISADVAQGTCTEQADIVNCAVGTLAPGQTVVATVVVEVAPAIAIVQNSASVSTSTSDTNAGNNVANTIFEPDIVADLAVVKSASESALAAGSAVDFTLDVSSAGPSVAQNVVLTDTMPDGFTVTSVDAPVGAACSVTGATVECVWATMVPGSATVVVHAIVEADAPAGASINTASIASPAHDPDAGNNSASVETTVSQSSDVRVEKTAASTGVPGSGFTYTIVVTNDGPSVARGVTLSDALPNELTSVSVNDADCSIVDGAVVCEFGDLAPEASVTIQITGAWRPTATGVISNTATTKSATPDSNQANNSSTLDVVLEPRADLQVTKSTSTPTVPVGEQASFLIAVRNDGPSAADGVIVTDVTPAGLILTGATPSAGTWSPADAVWTVGQLLPGESATIQVTAVGTQEGMLENTAIASSQTADPVASNNTARASITSTPSADVSIVKTASTSLAQLNAPIEYTIVVSNKGPSVATNVVVSDALPAALLNPTTTSLGCSITAAQLTCTVASLASGATFSATVRGTVNPASADNALANTATVTAATADPDTSNNTSTVSVPMSGAPRVELLKTGAAPTDTNGDGRIGAGDEIAYSFTVRNIGAVTLTGAQITDPLLGGAVTCAAFAGPLAPGAEVTCAPAAYTLTQDDVDAGTVHNTASVVAASGRGDVTDDAANDVSVPVSNSIVLSKSPGEIVDTVNDDAAGAGDTIDYTFAVTNSGTTTLRNVAITDAALGGTVTCAALDGVELAPGHSVVCAPVTYTLVQADVDAGIVHNQASVSADAPRATVWDTAETNVGVVGTAAIELHKSVGLVVDTNGDGTVGAGDIIIYDFVIRNLGTTTLTGVTVMDPLLGPGAVCSIASVPAVGTANCASAGYMLTQDDIEAETVLNTATATGTSPLGEVTDAASAGVGITGTEAMELTKTASAVDPGADGMIGVGDTVDFSFTIRNSGTTILRDIVLDDPLLGGAVECPALDQLALNPGDEVECGPVEYSITQQNVEDATVHNEATVRGAATNGSATASAEADVETLGTDGIGLVKSAPAIVDANGSGTTDAGDTIDYTFTVTNTGTTTLSGVSVTDPRVGGVVTCPAARLAPGEATICTGRPVALTQDEIEAGEIVNTATARATGIGPVSVDDTVRTPIDAQPAIALAAVIGEYSDANGDGKVNAGDTVRFRFAVTNIGARILTDVVLSDQKLGGGVDCDLPELAPGAVAECGPIEYRLTAADIQAGVVRSVSTVSAASAGIDGAIAVSAAPSASFDLRALAATGGVVAGLWWALALLVVGALAVLLARQRLGYGWCGRGGQSPLEA